jgi:hypothetical protein
MLARSVHRELLVERIATSFASPSAQGQTGDKGRKAVKGRAAGSWLTAPLEFP